MEETPSFHMEVSRVSDISLLLSLTLIAAASLSLLTTPPANGAGLNPVVEVEDDVYSLQSPDNGAGPMWSYGSSCLTRIGDRVFISAVESIAETKPLNNVRWRLLTRGAGGWDLVATGPGRTREPCPLGCFQDGSLFLSDNPTLTRPDERAGPAQPQIFFLRASRLAAPPEALVPAWDGHPSFTEHSYRSFAADPKRKELILFQNIGYTHAEWTFRDRAGNWSAHGKLKWPWGAEYPTPEPIRVCYPTIALKDHAVYFCGVSDIIEPYPEWREFKKGATGRDWDYDFRRLFFAWSDDIRTGQFHDWIEISSRDKTCGWLTPCDLWVAPDGAVHLLWTERALDVRLRDKFFPGEKQTQALMYAVVRDGKVVLKRPLLIGGEGASGELPGDGRFQITPAGRVYVFCYVSGQTSDGRPVSENRVFEVHPDGTSGEAAVVPLKHPFRKFYTATWRSGSPPSNLLDLYGACEGKGDTYSYARLRLRGS